MESQVGCKSSGLGTEVLFEDGIPRMETMDTLLRNLDEQLGDTNRQIEACVKSILEMSNGMLPSEIPKFYHPGEAVKTICDSHVLEKTACYDPEPDDITKLLRHILDTLDSSSGSEEAILQQILQLASQEGFSLPLQSTGSNPLDHSVMSINTAVNESESLNEALWNQICIKLKKYFVDKLISLSNSKVTSGIDLTGQRRLQYVQSLCSLYSNKDIWGRYRRIRSNQFGEKLLWRETYGMPNLSSCENLKFNTGVHHFEQLVLITQGMMQDDFALLNSGVFGSVISTMDALDEIYLDKILDDIGIIVDSLQNELSHVSIKPHKVSKTGDNKSIPKSTSEAQSLNQFRGNLRKQQSKSLDSLLSREDNFTDLQSLPTDIIGMLVRFMNCILNMDTYVQQLHSMLTWEMTHILSGKKHQKRLKSALRSRREPEKTSSRNRPLFLPSDSDLEATGSLFGPPNGGTSNTGTAVSSQPMRAEMTSSLRVVQKQSQEKKLWDWKIIFHKVSADISKCVEQKISSVSEKVMEYDALCMEKSQCYDMVHVAESLVGGRLDYPPKISRGVDEFFQEVDILLVLAKAFSDGPLQIIHTSFMDSIAITLKNLYMKLQKLSSEVPDNLPITVWYQCLSNSAFIRNHLLYYESLLSVDDNNSKKTVNGLYRKFCELCDSVVNQIIEYEQSFIATSLIHDAESHNWEDTKDFFEDERCSFDIQMWNLHMKSLQYDLWSYCPPLIAQSIYCTILEKSLFLYEQRYSAVKPSYRRMKQVKFDITAILLCTVELLMPACSNVGMFLDPNSHHKSVYSVHNSCCTLLSVVAMVTSPLECIYKVFKKGFKRRHSRNGDSQLKMYLSHWLFWVQPLVFPHGKDCIDDFQTTTALYLQLKILYAQPDIKWNLYLEALIMKEYTLPIMILAQAASHLYSPIDIHNVNLRKGRKEAISETTDILNLFTDFTKILILLDGFPEALSKVFLPVFERTDSWEMLDNETILGRTTTTPPWIEVLLNCLQKFVKRAIEAGVKVLLFKSEYEDKETVDPIISVLDDLPCGCEFTKLKKSSETPRKTFLIDEMREFSSEDDKYSTDAEHKDITAEAIYSVLVQMNEDVYVLPTPLIMLFKALQDQVNQKGLHSPHNCVAIKLLATSLRGTLIDTDLIETWLGSALSEKMKDSIRMLAECTYHVLTATSSGKSSGVPRIASIFMKANRNWLSEQIELLSDHFSNDLFELPETPGTLNGITEDYKEQLMTSVISPILNSPSGLHHLMNCYCLIENNLDWVINQLDIPQLFGGTTVQNSEFRISIEIKERNLFNPLIQYQTIGSVKFDQARIGTFEYNWMNLLQSDTGLSEVGMKTLLYHRHEMQDGAYLEENEKKPVEVLRKKFENDNSDV